ncbi:MAG TPA: hypothetical protein VF015_07865, partial [Acidimicrobiales bacterium]
MPDPTTDSPEPPPPPAARPEPDGLDAEFERVTRRRRWPVALLGLVVVAALVASMVMVRGASSGDGGGADPASPATTLAPATEAEVEAAVAEISAFVERERGTEFR